MDTQGPLGSPCSEGWMCLDTISDRFNNFAQQIEQNLQTSWSNL